MKTNKQPGRAGASPPPEPFRLRAAKLLAAPVSGLLLIPAFAPYNITILAWVALVPLLWSLGGTTLRGAALRGYLFGVAYLASLFWWLAVVRYPAPLGYAVFAAVLPAVFIPWAMLANRLMRRPSAVYRIWLPTALWVLFEYVMSHGTFALPWWALANTQARNLVTAQVAALGGVYFISFLIVLVNFVLYSIFSLRGATARGRDEAIPNSLQGAKQACPRESGGSNPELNSNKTLVAARPSARGDLATWIAAAALLAFTLIYGGVSLTAKVPTTRPVRLALIQANFDQNKKDEYISEGVLIGKHIEMTDAAVAKEHPDMVVWSESIAPLEVLNGPRYQAAWLGRVNYYNATLLTGVYNWDNRNRSYNSVVAYDPGKGLLGEYRKIQVVPFGEFFPYRALIEKISPWAGRWINKEVYEYDTYPGKEHTVFNSRAGKFGAVICFESVFPQLVRPLVRRGAEFLFVITNDAWFYDTPGTYQHAAMAALRAIENRRYVVQAANTGISTIIDPYGRTVAETKIFVRDTLFGEIHPEKGLTPYTRFGDVIVWLCLIFAVPALATFIVSGRKTPAAAPPAPAPKPKSAAKKKSKKR